MVKLDLVVEISLLRVLGILQMNKFLNYIILICLLIIAVSGGCSKSTPPLSDGILVTFDVSGETYKVTYKVFITNEDTIEEVFAVQQGKSQATIPSGRLIKGSVSYNEPWSWHIDSEDIHVAEFTIELCDGLPSHVEADLDYWVSTVKRFCPWNAKIVEIEDFR
jgi:hypothetical protein